MTAARDPMRKRHGLTEAQFRRVDAVASKMDDHLGELRALRLFWHDFAETLVSRIERFGDLVYLSDRELEIVEEIAGALERDCDVVFP